MYCIAGSPLYRENGPKNPCQGKHREFGKFDYSQLLVNFYFRILICLPSQFCVWNSHKSHNKHRENLPSDRENTRNLKMQFEWGPCISVIKSITRYNRSASGPTFPTSRNIF